METPWQGIFCALWTPTGPDGEILEGVLKSNLAFLRQHRVHGLLALGSTGEFLQLDLAKRKHFLELVVASANGLPVIVNVSDLRPKAVREMARFAKQIAAAAVALLPPYFYSATREDMVEFFVRAGEETDLPLFLYNYPERTGNRIDLETVAAVASRVRLAGMKQSGADFGYHQALVQLGREKGFVVLTGSDTRLPEALEMGVVGGVSGLANAVPDLVRQVFDDFRKARPVKSSLAQERMKQIGELVERLEFPMNVAASMEARGLQPGEPKSLISSASRRRQADLANALREKFREWGLAGAAA